MQKIEKLMLITIDRKVYLFGSQNKQIKSFLEKRKREGIAGSNHVKNALVVYVPSQFFD